MTSSRRKQLAKILSLSLALSNMQMINAEDNITEKEISIEDKTEDDVVISDIEKVENLKITNQAIKTNKSVDPIPVHTISERQTWSNKIIDGDVYITPGTVVDIRGNVTINGNVYVLGAIRSFGGLNVRGTLYVRGVNWTAYPPSSVSLGYVYLSGNNSFEGLSTNQEPPLNVYGAPFIKKEDKTISISGATYPLLYTYINGEQINLDENGTFNIENYNIGDKKEVTFKVADIFGNETTKVFKVYASLAEAPNVSCDTESGYYPKGHSVALDTDVDSMIYYTVDGSEPTTSSNVYKQPIPINSSINIKYFAKNELGNVSQIYSNEYEYFEIDEIADNKPYITGKASYGTKVSVNSNGKSYEGSSNKDGVFKVEIDKLNAGDRVEIILSNDKGLKSNILNYTVKDKTAPSKPTVEGIVSEDTSVIRGKAEPNSNVALKIDGRIKDTDTADKDGNFEFYTSGYLKKGQNISITSSDAFGNESLAYTTTVVDIKPPSKPIVKNDIHNTDSSIDVEGEEDSVVYAMVDGKVIGQCTIKFGDGYISVYNKLPSHNRATIQLVAEDESGNRSEILEKPIIDKKAPKIIEVDDVKSSDTIIKGKSEPYSTVYAKISQGSSDEKIFEGIADKNGDFEVEVDSLNNVHYAYLSVTDEVGLKSNSHMVEIKDVDPPQLTNLYANAYDGMSIGGDVNEYCKVTIKKDGEVITQTQSEKSYSGDRYYFGVYLPKELPHNTKLTIEAVDSYGNKSKEYEVIVKDTKSPEISSVYNVTDQSTFIEGLAEAKSTVIAWDYTYGYSGKEIGRTVVKDDGHFKIDLKDKLKARSDIRLSIIDEAGNENYEKYKISVQDITPPSKPIVEEVNNNSFSIDGRLENGKDEIIYVTASVDGKVVGQSNTYYGGEGKFSIWLTNTLKEDTKVVITTKDEAGLVGESTEIIVGDVRAPEEAPTLNTVADNHTVVTGKSEPYATVYAETAPQMYMPAEHWKPIGNGKADANGNYKVSIPKQKANTAIRVYQADKSGNVNKWADSQTVVIDKTPPKKPSINYLTEKSNEIKIKADANTVVEVIIDDTSKGRYWVHENGEVNITLFPYDPKLKVGSKIKVIPSDIDNNIGEALIVTVNKAITDIDNHWAKSSIVDFIERGYVGGYSDATFRPDNPITRGEFVKILNSVFGLTKSSGIVFKDTKNHWARYDIDIAVTNGVCSGKTASEFKPNDYITREEVAVMIANYKKLGDYSYDKINKYNDSKNVSSWAKPSVEGILEKGYMGGYHDNTFRPKGKITRAEAVATLSRI